ncbi:LPXTG cell wall anchor domain-containing protein [Streptomyces sp. NPDC093089]|uniref:LPXTG cell wall anchor domain-containing protein n=1 Tax=Streptomyces sp. NPDC093089 TaxID=3366024 RepID=UPI00381CD5C2
MTKQMRIRMARVAAGAVIAAGASLTAAGAAQAVGAFGADDVTPPPPTCAPVGVCETDGPPTTPDTTPPTTPPTTPETTPPTTPPVTTPPVTTPPVTTPPVTTPPATTPPATTPPVTTPPTTPPGGGETTAPGPGETTAPTNPGGGDPTDGAGDPGTCTVDLDGAECVDTGNNTDTNNAGSQPVQQGQAKEELAETGAAETSFLVIGAATMIAGGIGFRMLPRLVGGGRAAV